TNSHLVSGDLKRSHNRAGKVSQRFHPKPLVVKIYAFFYTLARVVVHLINIGSTNENVFLCSCHSIQDSLLSSNSSFTGYRGILNWIIILLVSFSALPSHLTSMCTSHCLKSTFMLCPPGGAFFSLLFYTILGMKLYSYQETNRWYRLIRMDLIFNSVFIFSELYYFLLAPTLCFQRGFPCSPKVRINKLLHRLLEMVKRRIEKLKRINSTNMDDSVFSLQAPTHFLWLLFFFLTHSYLNFCAELLRFGDRHFYGDWWNATTLIAFWKNWNIPFQRWCHSPLLCNRIKLAPLDKLTALMSCDGSLLSPTQYMIALPLHSCRLWIFLMMVFEGNYGNGLVWLFLLLGPPLAVTTYFHDHYVSLHINRHLLINQDIYS
uniref:diacylglycerol O-acyltransferase n=1 Tax=Oreochromis niloticus TaxID=8128 RepID=A0A669F1R1_ORENI